MSYSFIKLSAVSFYTFFSFQDQSLTNTDAYLLNQILDFWSVWVKRQEEQSSALVCSSSPSTFSSLMRWETVSEWENSCFEVSHIAAAAYVKWRHRDRIKKRFLSFISLGSSFANCLFSGWRSLSGEVAGLLSNPRPAEQRPLSSSICRAANPEGKLSLFKLNSFLLVIVIQTHSWTREMVKTEICGN